MIFIVPCSDFTKNYVSKIIGEVIVADYKTDFGCMLISFLQITINDEPDYQKIKTFSQSVTIKVQNSRFLKTKCWANSVGTAKRLNDYFLRDFKERFITYVNDRIHIGINRKQAIEEIMQYFDLFNTQFNFENLEKYHKRHGVKVKNVSKSNKILQ